MRHAQRQQARHRGCSGGGRRVGAAHARRAAGRAAAACRVSEAADEGRSGPRVTHRRRAGGRRLARRLPGLRARRGRLHLGPPGREPRPLARNVRPGQPVRVSGARRAARRRRRLRGALRDGAQPRSRRADQAGAADLRRLPVAVPRVGGEGAPRLLERRPGAPRLLRRHALPEGLRHAAPARPAHAGRGRQDRGARRPLPRLPPADLGVGRDEPDDAEGGDARVGASGDAEAPAGRAVGTAAPRPWRRQLGQLGDRGRHHLPRRLALFAPELRRRAWQDARSLPHARGLLLRPVLPEPDVARRHGARLRRRRLAAELAALPRVLRDGRRAPERPGDEVGRAAPRRAIPRPQEAHERRPRLLPAGRLPVGPRRHRAARAVEPERRGHGGRAGQEGGLPRRLEGRLDLHAADVSRRRRRRDELPRLPARQHPGRGREDDPRPRRREQHLDADERRVAAAPRRRLPRLHAERPLRRLPPGLLPQPPVRAAGEDLDGAESG